MYGVCSTSLYGNPLHYASMRGDLELMRMLLERGVDVEANDDDHSTALDVALIYGHGDNVKLLSGYGTK